MRILIVDSNLVFARKVGEFLQRHLKEVIVDYASNVPILRRRLRDPNAYDYIIADIFTAFDAKAMHEVLRTVDTPMLVWSILKSPEHMGVFRGKLAKQVVPKPDDEAGIEAAMSSVMTQTVGH